MADFIPATDGDFDSYTDNFNTYVNANLADFGLVAGDVAALNAAQTAWDAAYPAVAPAVAAATAATTAKNTARDSLVTAIRSLVKIIQAKPSVTDESKQAIGITVADTAKTPVGVPTTAPTAMVEQTNRLQHTIHFADSTTPTSKAKPAGVRGAQVWVKVGTAPPASEFGAGLLTPPRNRPQVSSICPRKETFGHNQCGVGRPAHNCTTSRPTRAPPTSPSSTPPTPAKPPTTGSAGKTPKANPAPGPQRRRQRSRGNRINSERGIGIRNEDDVPNSAL